jgi:hypothetical protein
VSFDDPNAALWASITPAVEPPLSTKVRRRVAALSPDMLAHRLRLALPGIFRSHETAFYAVLGGAMALGASVGLLGFAAADALKTQSSAVVASPAVVAAPEATASAEPARPGQVVREAPSLRPAIPPAPQPSRAALGTVSAEAQTLTAVKPPAAMDDGDAPVAPRAKRQHAASKYGKKKAKRSKLKSKRPAARRAATKGRTRNEKARALARALGS